MAPDTLSPIIETQTMDADGFVVVSVWKPGRYNSTRHTYDFFNTLPCALAHHNAICAGLVRDYEPNGIFPAKNGLPIGGALDAETLQSVEPGPRLRLWDGAKSTPENKLLKEQSLRFAGGEPDTAMRGIG